MAFLTENTSALKHDQSIYNTTQIPKDIGCSYSYTFSHKKVSCFGRQETLLFSILYVSLPNLSGLT